MWCPEPLCEHHPGTCYKGKFSGPTLDLLNHKHWSRAQQTGPPGEADMFQNHIIKAKETAQDASWKSLLWIFLINYKFQKELKGLNPYSYLFNVMASKLHRGLSLPWKAVIVPVLEGVPNKSPKSCHFGMRIILLRGQSRPSRLRKSSLPPP